MRFIFISLLALCFIASVQADPLPASVRQALRQAGIPQSGIAVQVMEAGKRTPLISINAHRPMSPASTMKLLTTFAGLDLLGPDYTWKTEAWIDGDLKDGVLKGNLILKGYGDPKFTVEQFWLWLSELRARGLREIRGDLILDRSYFDLPPYNPGEFDNDPLRAYNVGPDALLVNFNVVHFQYLPDGPNLKVSSEPRLDGVTLDNQLRPNDGKTNCNYWDDQVSVQPRGDSVVFQGDYPVGCGEREQNLSVMPHTRYVGALFSAVWKELGGTLQGTEREGLVTGSAKLFSTHRSEPLSVIIRDINKFSNNVMARQLFLTLGESLPDPLSERAASGDAPPQVTESGQPVFPPEPGQMGRMSIERSILAMRTWLARNDLDFRELILENGAGLSRTARISAAHMAQLLQLAYRHPLSAELQASLPILGVDGSVRKRLRDSPAASFAHLKTGTLESVKTIAGYVQSHSGRKWIVVFFINHPNARAGQEAQDTLIDWLQEKH
jgi:serine-type D-Ala-D-Ala carboxypeptidase/endopeptidase (penicillin-binding protein 4)